MEWIDYNGNKHLIVEVIEIHKFASPDDVKDLDFPATTKQPEDKLF